MTACRRQDVAVCREILRGGSRSFAAASALLPRRVRESATVLYAFCRVADDRIDQDPLATRAAVDELRARLDRAYAGRPADDPVDRALSAVALRERLPHALPCALLEGLAWDAARRRYETLDELYAYGARVAGAVGAMMSVLMGRRAPEVLARACDLGVAMQLTNIARDVGEDARRGRIYLPLAWMREEGLEPDAWLARPSFEAPIARVVRRLLDAADALYRRADLGVPLLPADCRIAIRAARLIYSDIGRVIARNRFDSVNARARVGAARKVWLLLRAIGARFAPRAAPEDPPLESTRFLVDACSEAAR